MKTLLIIAICLTTILPVSASEIWGGKWSNSYMVFFEIDDTRNPSEITYLWEEKRDEPLRKSPREGDKKHGIIKVGSSIYLKITGNTAILYGNFSRPRSANVVRLKIKNLDKANLSALLDAGWTEKAIVDGSFLMKSFHSEE